VELSAADCRFCTDHVSWYLCSPWFYWPSFW